LAKQGLQDAGWKLAIAGKIKTSHFNTQITLRGHGLFERWRFYLSVERFFWQNWLFAAFTHK